MSGCIKIGTKKLKPFSTNYATLKTIERKKREVEEKRSKKQTD